MPVVIEPKSGLNELNNHDNNCVWGLEAV